MPRTLATYNHGTNTWGSNPRQQCSFSTRLVLLAASLRCCVLNLRQLWYLLDCLGSAQPTVGLRSFAEAAWHARCSCHWALCNASLALADSRRRESTHRDSVLLFAHHLLGFTATSHYFFPSGTIRHHWQPPVDVVLPAAAPSAARSSGGLRTHRPLSLPKWFLARVSFGRLGPCAAARTNDCWTLGVSVLCWPASCSPTGTGWNFAQDASCRKELDREECLDPSPSLVMEWGARRFGYGCRGLITAVSIPCVV